MGADADWQTACLMKDSKKTNRPKATEYGVIFMDGRSQRREVAQCSDMSVPLDLPGWKL